MSKPVKYIVAIVVLFGLNLFLFYSNSNTRSSSFDDALFVISDTSQIASFNIVNDKGIIEIVRNQSGWMLNNTWAIDQNFLNVFFSIMNRVRVKRQSGEIKPENAGTLTIRFEDGSERAFNFTADAIGTKSYFIEDRTSYQVEVPGYRDNVVNILELSEDQWRSRTVFDGSWRTIQKLTITSSEEELTIRFNDKFFTVDGVNQIDSSAVVDYLNQFQFWQANEMISPGRFPQLDSLKELGAHALLTIDDIKSEEPVQFKIYSALPGQSYHLVTKHETEMMVFDSRRIQSILRPVAHFEAK
ncbi:MAG: hypothetical protein RIM99_12975 [Cyclobacteriaceae bacterium]